MSSEDLGDEDLELIRRRKLSDLQRAMAEGEKAERVQKQLEAQRESLLRAILEPEARQRLANIRMVRPEFAEQLELQLIQLAQAGRLRIPLKDSQLKETLRRLQSQRRDITIRRI
ncbi:DNA-binding protein [Candidatus Bathyarchaeota archaeon]|nr:DNA-binding protein [Candidatus Bathyarchaeota archaeon]